MQQLCNNCSQAFEITDDDLKFYDKISPIFNGAKAEIPPPTHCPDCRRQRKLAWRNERTLYSRTCDLCKKNIVNVHSPENPYPVYCNPCWWSDKWDPLSFSREYDPSRTFFEQYRELHARVPQRAMVNDNGVMSTNCEYVFDVSFSKNCYLCFGMWKAQDCLYCRICDQSKFCVDCEGVKLGSELVYESVDSQRLYNCAFLQNSENCNDCFFGFDLKGCSDCVGCVSLRQKRFCIFNEQFSQEEYKKKFAEMNLNSRFGLKILREKFDEFAVTFPRKNMNLQNCENCLGDHLFNCRNVLGYVTTNSENSRWVGRSDAPLWCYDVIQSGVPQLSYESLTTDLGYMVLFSLYCNESHYAYYSDNCLHCDNIFGCVSLRRKKYCILNQQYEKEDFDRLSLTIAEQMRKSGQLGEFFPIAMSPYGYNETNAAEFFPMTQENVTARDWKWRTSLPYTTGKETIATENIPDNIRATPDSILKEILACAECRKNYKLVAEELSFYRQMKLPVPDRCPDCRNRARLSRRNSQNLWDRACAKCGAAIKTTYAPDRPEAVYCEQCYLKSVY
jgi:Zn ribbon nucleic-acid-binding protein